MKNFLFLVIAFFAIQIVSAQDSSSVLNDKVYNAAGVDVKPEFLGGIEEFYKFIAKNYKLPSSKDFSGGKVYVSFIVEKDGSLVDIRVLKDVGIDTGKEAIRVLELCPKWSPGVLNGKRVRCSYCLPINLEAYVFKTSEVEVKPEFLGGMDKFYDFVRKNYKMLDLEGLKGKVYLTFIIEKDGSLNRIKVIRDLGYGTGQEAIRVLQNCPKWKPAEQNGQKVRCLYSLPITLQSS